MSSPLILDTEGIIFGFEWVKCASKSCLVLKNITWVDKHGSIM